MPIFRPALTYFAIVFAVGFVLGIVRVGWLVPRLGARAAELIEMPLMLLTCYYAARWVVRRFQVPPLPAARLAVGFIALACLLAVEFTVVIWMQGISVREAIAGRDPVSGMVYALSLMLFALMPLLIRIHTRLFAKGD